MNLLKSGKQDKVNNKLLSYLPEIKKKSTTKKKQTKKKK